MMDRTAMLLRLGFYAGRALRDLGDSSYYLRWHGRAQDVTEQDYLETIVEIQRRLVEAGKIEPDEDPYDRE